MRYSFLVELFRNPKDALPYFAVAVVILIVTGAIRRQRLRARVRAVTPAPLGDTSQGNSGPYTATLSVSVVSGRTRYEPSSTWCTVVIAGLRIPAEISFENSVPGNDIPIGRLFDRLPIKPLPFALSTVIARGKPVQTAAEIVRAEAVVQAVLNVFDAEVSSCTVSKGTLRIARRTDPEAAQQVIELGVELARALDAASEANASPPGAAP